MIEDSVIKEVRATRDAYARSFGYDVRAIVADLRARDDRGDWPVVRLAPRRPPNPAILHPMPGEKEANPDLKAN